jgi:hypothetical protein
MTKHISATALAVLMVPLAIHNCSCALVAWTAAQFGPKAKIAAQYEPPAGRKILVFVDDMEYPVSHPPIKIHLTKMLNNLLVANGVAAQTVPYERLADFIGATPRFNELSVAEVGRKLDAEIVLYVRVDQFALKDQAAMDLLWRGQFQTTVRMVHVVDGPLWPKDRPSGHTVDKVETPPKSADSDTDADEITKVLASKMADRIAKLFYEHKDPYEGGWSEERNRSIWQD